MQKWDHRSGESQRCVCHNYVRGQPQEEREDDLEQKRKLPSLCFFVCLNTISHTSFDCNHFVKANDIKKCVFPRSVSTPFHLAACPSNVSKAELQWEAENYPEFGVYTILTFSIQ